MSELSSMVLVALPRQDALWLAQEAGLYDASHEVAGRAYAALEAALDAHGGIPEGMSNRAAEFISVELGEQRWCPPDWAERVLRAAMESS